MDEYKEEKHNRKTERESRAKEESVVKDEPICVALTSALEPPEPQIRIVDSDDDFQESVTLYRRPPKNDNLTMVLRNPQSSDRDITPPKAYRKSRIDQPNIISPKIYFARYPRLNIGAYPI